MPEPNKKGAELTPRPSIRMPGVPVAPNPRSDSDFSEETEEEDEYAMAKIHRLDTDKAGDKIDSKYLTIPGKHPDGGGLYLQVAEEGQASYVWRHKETWRSIGPEHLITIRETRYKSHEPGKAVHEKRNPFDLLKTLRGGPTAAGGKTFAQAMTEFLDANSSRLSASNRDRTRRDYEYQLGQVPDFVALPLKAIDQDKKNAALATWNDRAGIREKVGYYIGAILDYAATGRLKLRAGNVKHHEPMPYASVPAFFRKLGALGTVDAKALQWTILTGARTDEVIGSKKKGGAWNKHPATWGEIKTDTDGKLSWVIPRRPRQSTASPYRRKWKRCSANVRLTTSCCSRYPTPMHCATR
jgi:hypothetical protein